MKLPFRKYKTHVVGVVFMLFYFINVNAQNNTKLDLNNYIKKSSSLNFPDTFKNTQIFVDVSINIARAKWKQNDDSTLIILNEIEKLLKKINGNEYLGVVVEEKGVYHSVNRRYNESIPYFKEAIALHYKYPKENKLAYN